MIEIPKPVERCANEGCARRAEPGELWCSECGLERSLYRRDNRRDPRETPTKPGVPEARG
jgi:hypothetical protein